MNGRIPEFEYNPKNHTARFALRPTLWRQVQARAAVDAPSRADALVLWQAFRDEVSGVDPEQPKRGIAPQSSASASGIPEPHRSLPSAAFCARSRPALPLDSASRSEMGRPSSRSERGVKLAIRPGLPRKD